MHDLTRVIIRSGLIPKEKLDEFRKWGLVLPNVEPPPAPTDPMKLVEQIDRALQEEDLVMVRETDMTAIREYMATVKNGTLHLVVDDLVQGESTVGYGITKMGEYLLPWAAESVDDLLTNGETYLLTAEGAKVYFSSIRELFFGDQKAFVVCKSSVREEPNGHQQAIDAPQE